MVSKEDVKQIVKRNLKYNLPFSLVRIGDGEGMMFDYEENWEGANFISKKHLGYTLSKDQFELIRKDLVKTYSETDMIGIPTGKHLKINKGWKRAYDIADILRNDNAETCSIDIHHQLLEDGFYDELLSEAKKLLIISGRDVIDKIQNKFPNIKESFQIQVTPEMKWEENKNQIKHFPNQYENVEDVLKRSDLSGYLCLVGAGTVGKVYNIWCKERGGVSIDIGSVFDVWVGKSTRGPERGDDSKLNKYKL